MPRKIPYSLPSIFDKIEEAEEREPIDLEDDVDPQGA